MKYVLLLNIIFASFSGHTAHASLVSEVEPGFVELRGTQDGSLVSSNIFSDKKRRWIYVEIKEGREVRYFYAPFKDFSLIQSKKRFKSLQYGIGHRIQNTKGKIPFGPQRYFYPLVDFKLPS